MSSDDPFPGDAVGQPVELAGRWLPRSTLYVADRGLHGRRGVWAVTPVEVCADGTPAARAGAPAVLVVRGWAPTLQAAPPPPTGPVRRHRLAAARRGLRGVATRTRPTT